MAEVVPRFCLYSDLVGLRFVHNCSKDKSRDKKIEKLLNMKLRRMPFYYFYRGSWGRAKFKLKLTQLPTKLKLKLKLSLTISPHW